MDDNFDAPKAHAIINAFVDKHGQSDSLPAGGHYVTTDFSRLTITVDSEEEKNYTLYRLLVEDDEEDGEVSTELTLFTVAVLAQKLFPPFKPRRQYTHNRHALYAGFTQSATLAGVDTDIMSKSIDAAKAAYIELERHVPKAATFPSERIGMNNFVVSNPYFVVGDEAKDKVKVPFPKNVDPFDDLNRAQGDGCVHTADNDVQYMQSYVDDDGILTQIPIPPNQFRPGDIVRVGFSAIFKKEHKLHAHSELCLVLRSIELIDKTLSTEIAVRELHAGAGAFTKKRASVTRGKFAVDAEDRPMSKVRKALAKMSLGADMVMTPAASEGVRPSLDD